MFIRDVRNTNVVNAFSTIPAAQLEGMKLPPQNALPAYDRLAGFETPSPPQSRESRCGGDGYVVAGLQMLVHARPSWRLHKAPDAGSTLLPPNILTSKAL